MTATRPVLTAAAAGPDRPVAAPPTRLNDDGDVNGPAGDASAADEVLVLPRCRRAVVEKPALLGMVAVTLLAVLIHTVGGPIDTRVVANLALAWWWTPLVVVAVAHAGIGWAAIRPRSITVTPAGVTAAVGPVSWGQVCAVDVVRWPWVGRRIRLRLYGGDQTTVPGLCGTRLLPDPRFDRAVADLRDFADRHAVPTSHGLTWHPRRWVVAAVAAVCALAVAAVGMRAVWRGAIGPWTPTAKMAPAACPTVERAGLGRLWPARGRVLAEDRTHRWSSQCAWVGFPTAGWQQPEIRQVAVYIDVYSGTARRSGIGEAIDNYQRQRQRASALMDSTRTLPAVGDQAYIGTDPGRATVTARTANIIVTVTVYDTMPWAKTTADLLAAGIVNQIHPR
jgi:hypothetical protein